MVTKSRRGDTGTARRTRSRASRQAHGESEQAEETQVGNGADGAQRASDGLFEDVGSVSTAVAVGVAAALIESELIPGILIGAGAVLLGKMFPRVAAGMRPVAKTVIRAGIAMTDKARTVAAEAGEQVQDMVAEVQAERERSASERPRSRRASPRPASAAVH